MKNEINSNNTEQQHKEEKKGMELWMKILLAIAGTASVGIIVYGVSTYQKAQEQELKQAAQQQTIIQAQDTSQNKTTQSEQTTEQLKQKPAKTTEQVVDNLIQEDEAEQAFNTSGLADDFKEQFIEAYIKLKNEGVGQSDIIATLTEKFNKEASSSVMGNAAGDQAEIEDEYDKAYQEQLDAEEENITKAEEIEQEQEQEEDFQILLLDETIKYAKQKVNIRRGPGTKYEKIGSLSMNEKVIVTGLVPDGGNDWYLIVDENDEALGYVSTTYLVDEKVKTTTQKTTPPSTTETTPTQTTETPTQTTPTESSPTGAGTIAPSGDIVGRGPLIDGGDGSGEGGSGNYDNVVLY